MADPTLRGIPLERAGWVGALTLPGFLAEVVARHGRREALVFDDPLRDGRTTRLTYDDLGAAARRVTKALVAASVGTGSRVGILMGNRPEAVAAFFGAAATGAVVVLMSTFSTREELAHLLAHSDTAVLLTQTTMRRHDFLADVAALCPQARTGPGPPILSADLPALRHVAVVGLDGPEGAFIPWEAFLAGGDPVPDDLAAGVAEAVHPSDHAVVIYSSGTTALPKGILHHHRSPSLQFWNQGHNFGRGPATRMWTALPVFWTAGLCTGLGATLATGGCWVMQESFDPGAALALIARERVTEAYSLPHQTAAMEEHPDWPTADLSSLRSVYGTMAFARHPSVTDPDPNWRFPVGYGLTETCANVSSHLSTDPLDVQRASAGRLLPGNEVRIVDPDTHELLGPNQSGEITVQGPTLMEQYLRLTREECFDHLGFFHTGDAGFFDEDGYLHWTGRRTEMIKTGMANVSPAELEVAMRACRPVKLARVVGVPDAALGQRVIMCVTVKEGEAATEDEIKTFLAERVAAYKVPKRVLFFDEGQIPMTSSDTKVRDAELLGLVEAKLAAETAA
ncbi:MAG TPA: class I adenylate-forming enzyme family protein [Acidimicrobiales bacterium]|nr:class I adenylate-forming enzyme family protein [Acidimicrobiales bacterium]